MDKVKIRMGMVGGGTGSFIGPVHRMAAEMDHEIELVCGAFSSNPERSKLSGEQMGIDPARCYPDYHTMINTEASLPAGKRMDFIAIVTPNHLHFEPAKLALENHFHVMCDKPLALSLDEALELQRLVKDSGLIFGITYTYAGYPLVMQAREMIRSGTIGKIRKVVVTYLQGWLSQYPEGSGQKQAVWRTDPRYTGKTSTMGDIGTHAEFLVSYLTGLEPEAISAQMNTLVPERKMDDDGTVLIRYPGGAVATLLVSQVATGEENNVIVRVYGEKGGFEWNQMEPNSLFLRQPDKPIEIYRTGVTVAGLGLEDRGGTRLPAGHPEGFIEAFANIYHSFARSLQKLKSNPYSAGNDFNFPTIDDGVRGMKFLEKVVEASSGEKKWIPWE
ncbi:MAG: Gfo/Idh/MocA family oxidoreductase [Chlorobi bacterium]|nr:Gfo/Idh/MocA family oxidoreductase [Chlorobiota bacterium]